MFKSEGRFPVTITEAVITESKFKTPDAFDVCLHVATDDGQSEDWNGEISNRPGRGNYADKTSTELTLMTLAKLGWKHGEDFSKIEELVGVKTVATTKAREYEGKTYYDVKYLGDGGNRPAKLTPDEIAARMAKLKGGGYTPPAAKAAPAQDDADYDPFANSDF